MMASRQQCVVIHCDAPPPYVNICVREMKGCRISLLILTITYVVASRLRYGLNQDDEAYPDDEDMRLIRPHGELILHLLYNIGVRNYVRGSFLQRMLSMART